jgi:hypothetical protein
MSRTGLVGKNILLIYYEEKQKLAQHAADHVKKTLMNKCVEKFGEQVKENKEPLTPPQIFYQYLNSNVKVVNVTEAMALLNNTSLSIVFKTTTGKSDWIDEPTNKASIHELNNNINKPTWVMIKEKKNWFTSLWNSPQDDIEDYKKKNVNSSFNSVVQLSMYSLSNKNVEEKANKQIENSNNKQIENSNDKQFEDSNNNKTINTILEQIIRVIEKSDTKMKDFWRNQSFISKFVSYTANALFNAGAKISEWKEYGKKAILSFGSKIQIAPIRELLYQLTGNSMKKNVNGYHYASKQSIHMNMGTGSEDGIETRNKWKVFYLLKVEYKLSEQVLWNTLMEYSNGNVFDVSSLLAEIGRTKIIGHFLNSMLGSIKRELYEQNFMTIPDLIEKISLPSIE